MARTKAASRKENKAERHRKLRQATAWSVWRSLSKAWFTLWYSITVRFAEMGILSHEQRNFLDEYGPALWDLLLCLPGMQYLRGLLRMSEVSTYDVQARTPLLELPHELLFMIFELLQPDSPPCDCARHSQQRIDFASLGMVNRRIRRIMASLRYKNVAIVHGWSRSYRAITTIARSPDISLHVQTFKLALIEWVGTGWMPATALAPKLAALLPTFARLNTLHLHIPAEQASRFRREFARSSLCLPNVESLVVGPDMEFVISHCPRVESIASIGWRWMMRSEADNSDSLAQTVNLIRATSFAEHLRHFELHEYWQSQHLRNLYQAAPGLESLVMRGHVAWEDPTQLLPAFQSFRKLKRLVLPPVRSLNVGFIQQRMCCGNPYLGLGGRKRLEQDSRQQENEALAAARPVAEMTLRQLSNVDQLWIGDYMLFTPVLAPDGALEKVGFRYEQRPKPPTLGD